jgi:hypothetical protein
MYLDSSGVLKAGPVWDFDNSLGNQVFLGNMNDLSEVTPAEFSVCFTQYNNNVDGIFELLSSHKEFRDQVYEVWNNEFRQVALDSISLINENVNTLSASAVMNGIRWNRYNTTNVDENLEKYKTANSDLIDFINSAIEFYDNEITDNSTMLFYDSNGVATNEWNGKYTTINDEVTVEDNIFTSNKKFLGWNTEADGSGTQYNVGDKIKLTDESTTLYAQWSDNESTSLKVKNKVDALVSKVFNSLKYRFKVVTG